MTRVLVAYDTKHGSTGQVAQSIADTLRGSGLDVHLERIDHVDDQDVDVDAVVVGAPVYTGRWTRDARSFLRKRHDQLASKPVAVFALGPLHDDADEFANARASVERALAGTPDVHPCDVRVFGGALDPSDHRFPFNRIPESDIRDWDEIRAWARSLPDALGVSG